MTKKITIAGTTVLALCFNSFAGFAAETTPIVVTATRTAQSANETLSPVIVITREDLQNESGAELVDVLRRYPGIDISRNGGPGQQSSVFIRGAESDHTLVMLDGIRINPGTIGTASIQNIPLAMIERIEIVKGPRSTLYGSDAIGGVINIITRKRNEAGTRYDAHVGGGSFGTVSAGFAAHNNIGDRAAGINVSASQSDGFPTLSSQQLDRGYDNLNVNLYGKNRINETDVTIEMWQSQGNTEYFGYDSGFALVPLDQDFRTSTVSMSFENNPTTRWSSTVKLSYFDDDIEQNQNDDFVQTRRTTLDWQNDVQISEAQLLTAGLYFADERTESISLGTGFDVDTDVSALFIQDDIKLDRHQLVAGARVSDHEGYGEQTTWNLEYGFQLNADWKLLAAANTGFRSPSSTDRFGFGGNPDLDPEESLNREIGLRFQKKSHRFSLTAFQNDIDDLIVYFDPDGFTGPTPGSNENIAESRIRGIEAGYEYSTPHWLFSVSGISQDPKNITDDTLLLRRAEQKYNAGLAYRADDYGVELDITHVSERADYGDVTLDAYTLAELRATYQFTDSLFASARIENLTDEDYQLVDGYNTPERSYYLKLHYSLD